MSQALWLLMVSLLVVFVPPGGVPRAWAAKRELQSADPIVRAILWGSTSARAWVDYNGFRYHLINGMRLEPDWQVEEIRRESVLFRHLETRAFLEAPLCLKEKAKRHHDWSFWGEPLGLWESLEMLGLGFNYNVVLHCQAGGPVVPRCHANSIDQFLIRTLPPHHRFAFIGPVLLVLPVNPGAEDWKTILSRLQERSAEALCLRFPGLRKPGSLLSRGDDIQMVLRQIAVGSGEKITFSRDLHFPVYAVFRTVPFSHILTKILYLNQCFLIERDSCLEVQSWPHPLRPVPLPPCPEMVVAGPDETPDGVGLAPPPAMPPAAGVLGNTPYFPPARTLPLPPLPSNTRPADNE